MESAPLYIIYKTTNLVNLKYYIGKHKTYVLEDGYLGSGKWLKYAIAKYGISNFVREVLHIFDSEELMNAKERELVTEEFCQAKDNYNICVGGQGGFSHINRDEAFRKNKNRKAHAKSVQSGRFVGVGAKSLLEKRLQNPEWALGVDRKRNATKKLRFGTAQPQKPLGYQISAQTRAKIAAAGKKRTGDKNSQFGTMWITDGFNNKKINNVEPIPEGWYRGRIKKG